VSLSQHKCMPMLCLIVCSCMSRSAHVSVGLFCQYTVSFAYILGLTVCSCMSRCVLMCVRVCVCVCACLHVCVCVCL
jgi:hypothetical protein